MKTYQQLKQEWLQDKEFARLYEESEAEFEITKALIQARIDLGLTQKQLADKIGTQQPSISRLESGDYNPSLEFLKKVAQGLGKKLVIGFI